MAHRPPRRLVLGTMAGGALASVAGSPPAHAEAHPSAATYASPERRRRIDLNSGWRFVRRDVDGAQERECDDSAWTPVSTPHTWNAADGADGGDDYYRGVGWYRQHRVVPAELAGKMLFLQFAGANQVADVWVNGTHLGQHVGGYARFRFDATEALRVDEDNVIAVRVTNADDPQVAPLSADFTFSGGLYRNVSLWAVDRLHVSLLDHAGPGAYLRQTDVTAASAKVTVTTKLVNHNADARSVAVRALVTDADGKVVADERGRAQPLAAGAAVDIAQTLTLARPHLWNGVADPYLYHATLEVHDVTGGGDTVTDVVTEPLGLRSVAVDPDRGFFLNGAHLHLHGVSLHQDRAVKGWAVGDADHVRDFDLISEIGATTVRMAHYQHDQKDYELADERGLLVWAEIPFVNETTDSDAFTSSTQHQMRELIRQNYNHPSIAFWGIGNEQGTDDEPTNALLASLAQLVETEDPDRISTYASHLDDDAEVGLHTEVSAWNKYFGWYTGSKDTDLGEWADTVHRNAPHRGISVSEYGAGANIAHHALNPAQPEPDGDWHPEEYQALYHEAAWRQLAARPYIWGTYVWNMFDFACDARDEGEQPGINDKGLVTRDRKVRKDAFYWYKANWSTSPTLYVTSRRWTERTDASTELKVYSNAQEVSATLNGASLGTRSSDDHIFTWPGVTLERGANEVTVTATIDGATHTDTVTWTLA